MNILGSQTESESHLQQWGPEADPGEGLGELQPPLWEFCFVILLDYS